jgi:hypothetical protein
MLPDISNATCLKSYGEHTTRPLFIRLPESDTRHIRGRRQIWRKYSRVSLHKAVLDALFPVHPFTPVRVDITTHVPILRMNVSGSWQEDDRLHLRTVFFALPGHNIFQVGRVFVAISPVVEVVRDDHPGVERFSDPPDIPRKHLVRVTRSVIPHVHAGHVDFIALTDHAIAVVIQGIAEKDDPATLRIEDEARGNFLERPWGVKPGLRCNDIESNDTNIRISLTFLSNLIDLGRVLLHERRLQKVGIGDQAVQSMLMSTS